MRFIIIGNPENRRVVSYLSALTKNGVEDITLLSYEELLSDKTKWLTVIEQSCFVKIESPGENHLVEQKIISLGLGKKFSEEFNKGLIANQVHWYKGFCLFLDGLAADAKEKPVHFLNSPADIKLFFNKYECQSFLSKQGINTPKIMGRIYSLDDFHKHMNGSNGHYFIKPSHSSSASGVMAYRKSGKRRELTAAIELIKEGSQTLLYNSLKVHRYEKQSDIEAIIESMAQHNLFYEQWIPKFSQNNRSVDLRIHLVQGQAQHIVVRAGKSYLTNLHLGNERGDLQKLKDQIGKEDWRQIIKESEKAAALFTETHYLGLDLVISRKHKPYIIECNAFGDLIPGALFEGKNTYESQIAHLI
ncbi:MAG: STM4014 family protein [Lentisphaerales bacterium]|nr:STM4014 family protein [Lentisphaerales bacterium]